MMYPGRVTCRFCGKSGLIWHRYMRMGRSVWLLADPSLGENIRHFCDHNAPFQSEPVENDDDPRKDLDVDKEEDKQIAEVKLDAVQVVRQALVPFTRDLAHSLDQSALQRTEQLVNAQASKLFDEVKKEMKNAIPREHFITVKGAVEEKKIQGRPHQNLQTLVDVMNLRMHVFMVGPAGSGKTTSATLAAKVLGLPYFESSMGPATSQWDLLGFRNAATGSYVPGILREPYENGGVLMLDEIDNSNPSVLTALNSALANDAANFPDARVKRHKDFVCISAGNTYGRGADRLYVGRTQLDAATLDRFVVIDWDYDEDAELDWAGRDQTDWIQYVQALRHKAFDLKKRVVISPRASIFGAKLLRAGMDQPKVEEMVLWKGISPEDKKEISNIVLKPKKSLLSTTPQEDFHTSEWKIRELRKIRYE